MFSRLRVYLSPAVLVALFAALWAMLRAFHQAITLDEADTFLAWVAPVEPNHWTPHSNNHVLNSLLMRLSVACFGLSHWAVRLPALLGGWLYIASAYVLSGLLTTGACCRGLVLACLVLNPFLSDYFVAARGYGLALGLWFCAFTLIAAFRLREQAVPLGAWGIASVLLALAFTANFAFAFIVATTWAALLVWTIASGRTAAWRITLAGTLPGALVILILPMWTLLHWPHGELWDGTRSLAETVGSVARASLHEPSAEIANPLIQSAFRSVSPFLLPAVSLLAICYAALHRRRGIAKANFDVGSVAALSLVAALLLHWLAYRWFGLLLPKVRTASYLIPAWTVVIGALAMIPAITRRQQAVRYSLLASLTVLAVFYTSCLRKDYFYEWSWCADSRDAWEVISHYSRDHGVTEVPSRSPMTSSLEFYRRADHLENLREFKDPQPYPNGKMPADKVIYALYESMDGDFIRDQKLQVLYRGRIYNDFVIAVRATR